MDSFYRLDMLAIRLMQSCELADVSSQPIQRGCYEEGGTFECTPSAIKCVQICWTNSERVLHILDLNFIKYLGYVNNSLQCSFTEPGSEHTDRYIQYVSLFFFPFDWVAPQNLKCIHTNCREKSYETLMTWYNVVSHWRNWRRNMDRKCMKLRVPLPIYPLHLLAPTGREQSVQALLSVEIKAINFPPRIVQR